MSGVCGWFDVNGTDPVDPGVIRTMAATLTRFDATSARSACAGWGAVAVAGNANGADLDHDADWLAAVWGRPHFSDAGLAELAQRRGPAHALGRGHADRGPKVLETLAGSFALAIFDRRSAKALLAIDRMGTRALYHTTAGGTLVFASTLDAISAFPGSSTQISRQSIYDYVYFHMVPGPQTIYANRERLLPGTYLTCDKAKRETAPYWHIRFD
jgi:asparagine synthase (glutamine-hydrolysing)